MTPASDILIVFDRFEVGPAIIHPRRLTIPCYLTAIDGTKHGPINLIFTYEEKVFVANDPACQNLAAMIGAQVAINYGLFCRRIIFHGPLDNTDQRFLKDMAENTAREIYVNKFLHHNPYLVGEAAHLQPVKKERYSNATMEFPGGFDRGTSSSGFPWTLDPERYAVLSSGGKDSLLTYGLLDELGYDTHPIYVNESGRHWFTALNAYRYFKNHIPATSRVWTNCDRVFTAIVRLMPFIREDLYRFRSDQYPIRLWTVAVFLFGALPVLRKRGIGRLTIGDEYDTTRRLHYKGITHYDGLYDQSIYFDNALTRYYLRKSWPLSQFSILRNVSELLIEKMLATRYPHLLEQQVSCHISHKEGDRIRPCGKCEKCRRIVAMLVALGADPRLCGYSENQINECVVAFARDGSHQESASVHYVVGELKEKGLLPPDLAKKALTGAHPEVTRLRFDPERSPMNGIPAQLRPALFQLFLEYADGAVERDGHFWKPFEPLKSPSLNAPYPFEWKSFEEK